MGAIRIKTSKETRLIDPKNPFRRNKMSLQQSTRTAARVAQTCIRQKSTSTVKNANQAAAGQYTTSTATSDGKKKSAYNSDDKKNTQKDQSSKYQREGHLLWHLL